MYDSIKALTDRDTIEIRREVVLNLDGESVKKWTVAERGVLPAVGVKCRLQANRPKEALEYGCRTEVRSWRIYFGVSGDPSISVQDRVYLTDTDGTLRECLVKMPSFSSDSLQARLWTAGVEEFGPAL